MLGGNPKSHPLVGDDQSTAKQTVQDGRSVFSYRFKPPSTKEVRLLPMEEVGIQLYPGSSTSK